MGDIDRIHAYVEAQPQSVADLLRAAHDKLCALGDQVEPVWKWQTPFYLAFGHNFAYLTGGGQAAHIGFYYGAKLPDPGGILTGYDKKQVRHYRLQTITDLNQDDFLRLLDDALLFNAQVAG